MLGMAKQDRDKQFKEDSERLSALMRSAERLHHLVLTLKELDPQGKLTGEQAADVQALTGVIQAVTNLTVSGVLRLATSISIQEHLAVVVGELVEEARALVGASERVQ